MNVIVFIVGCIFGASIGFVVTAVLTGTSENRNEADDYFENHVASNDANKGFDDLWQE